MDFIEAGDYSDTTSIQIADKLLSYTLEGDWENVKQLYDTDSKVCMININKSRGTALHVAVNDGNREVVRILVEAILKHQNEGVLEWKNEKGDTPLQKALELKNEKGDTPLHLAAARGFKDICKCIIGENGERKHLIDIDNNEGETPLFHAALSWQKETFVYLFSSRPTTNYPSSKDLTRKNGDSILHCAIRREFFDLALIIMNKCPELSIIQNKDGFSPLKLLATRPSAFRSGIKMIWWKCILYHCIPVGTLNVENAEVLYANKADEPDNKCPTPQNYDTCCLFVQKFQDIASPLLRLAKRLKSIILAAAYACAPEDCKISISEDSSCDIAPPNYAPQNKGGEQKDSQNDQHFKISISEDSSRDLSKKKKEEEDSSRRELVPPNYATCLWFLKFAYIYILGLSGVGIEDIKKMKQKHKWSGQLLNLFLEGDNLYESYLGSGGQPQRDVSETDFISAGMPKQENNDHGETTSETETLKNKTPISETQKMETAILTAARNGIVEMVNELISKIPSAVHETNMENKNVLPVAVENRRTLVVSETQKKETAILTAARNGIVEMVNELISKIPSAIHETNMENKNVLLVAVENRRTLVVEALRKRFADKKTKVVFDNLIQGVDKDENTVIHLAATRSDKDWLISGAALQMMWHIKWFQYVKQLVPEHFTVRTNKEEKTAGEIFKDSHAELVKSGSEWLKDTSESCSVVAALLAGVSFATSSTVPGGNRSETGEPALEGKPAFDAFALSSVMSLCFSVTALIMFLSILTSRKEAKDFKIDLPRKLLIGLSSLFVSIVAMFITFCSGHFFLIDQKYKHIVFLIYTVTCFPVSLYAVAQLPLYIDLLRGLVTKVPKTSDKGEDL